MLTVAAVAFLVVLFVSVAPRKGFMLVHSSPLPDRLHTDGRTFERGGERWSEHAETSRGPDPVARIVVLLGGDIPVYEEVPHRDKNRAARPARAGLLRGLRAARRALVELPNAAADRFEVLGRDPPR